MTTFPVFRVSGFIDGKMRHEGTQEIFSVSQISVECCLQSFLFLHFERSALQIQCFACAYFADCISAPTHQREEKLVAHKLPFYSEWQSKVAVHSFTQKLLTGSSVSGV